MEYFELTKEMMARAKTYMPIDYKETLARAVAFRCVKPMTQLKWDGIHLSERKEGEPIKDDPTSLPDLMEEDMALKMCLLQNVLLSYYFDVEMDEEADPYVQYDFYAGGHLLNQIERFKADRDVKNTAFDLIEDWREFKKMVDTIIYNYKMNANDPLKRIDAMLTVFSSPENIQSLMNELQKSADEVEEKVKDAKKGRKKSDKILEPIPEA